MVEKLRTSATAMREQANGRHIPFALLAFINVLFSNVKPKRKFDSLMTTISDLVPGCQIALLERQANEHLRIIQTSGLIDNTRFKTALPQFIEGEWYFLPNVQEERVWQEHYADCFPECQSALAAKFHTAKNHYLLLIMQPTLDGFNHPQRDELYALFDVTKSALYSMLQFRKTVIDKHQVQQEEKLASLGKLAAGVAHEINNPLGFVMSNFSILNEYISQISKHPQIQPIDDLRLHEMIYDSEAILMESLEGLSRIKNIVSSLNVYSHTHESMAEIDMRDVLSSALALIIGDLKYRAKFVYPAPEKPYYIRGTYNKLQQVFINLIINAVQSVTATQEGVVCLELSEVHWPGEGIPRVQVLIEDNGKGISAEHIEKVFDPFFTTKKVGEGAGLGLSVAREIIEEHHGKIKLCSTEGVGTRVSVTLPQAVRA
ncbi:sensor histidine kinase [Aeromonas veronii]|uniref:sensor histidine kinase n=1 Tax=Aeromonas veronii TaxID=654 RepID=UPI0015E68AB1|nr:ATP-binding protein [Aeromonas veronii]MBA2076596.1 two-component sensor histidine kinase [Aeromonas veronii]